MFNVRKLYLAVPFAALFTLACNANEALEPTEALLAKGGNGGSGGGYARWSVGTGYDFDSHTFEFRASGLGPNRRDYQVRLSATLSVTYDCANPSTAEILSDAHIAASESINASETFAMSSSGNLGGAVSLDLANPGSLRCAQGWVATNLRVLPGSSVLVEVAPAHLPSLTYTY